MAYSVPRVLIEQEFVQAPIFSNNPLAAFIFGPNYQLFRYDEPSEKASCLLTGPYTASGLTAQEIVYHTVNSAARADITKNTAGTAYNHVNLIFENAFVKYFADGFTTITTAPGASDDEVTAITTTGDLRVANKIKATTLSFKPGVNPSTGVTVSRSAWFSTRDVQVGDWVSISGMAAKKANGNWETVASITTQIIGIEVDTTADPATGRYDTLVLADAVWASATDTTTDTLLHPGVTTIIQLFARVPEVKFTNALKTTHLTDTVGSEGFKFGVAANITTTVPGLVVTATGVLASLPIVKPIIVGSTLLVNAVDYKAADTYVEYRVIRTDNTLAIASLDDPANVEAALGPVTPENPLAEGVYDALLNSSGTPVYFMGVATDDLTGYNAVLEYARRSDAIYGLVPLTFDSTIQDAMVAHVNALSTAANAKWRKVWISSPLVTSGLIPKYVEKTPDVAWTGTPGTDPQTTLENTLLTVSGATFVTDGVRIGDYARVAGTDYLISAVRGETQLVIATCTAADSSTVQILKTYTKDEQVANLAAVGSRSNSSRVIPVFPDYVKTGGVTKAGYFVAAALAGLRAGSVPHQPLTNVEVLGFDDFTASVTTFTDTQLNVLAAAGYWIVTQDVIGGAAYTRQQLTSDSSSIVFAEDSITTNLDSISYGLQRVLSPYIGKYNINPDSLSLVESAIRRQLMYHSRDTYTTSAGYQVLAFTVKKVAQNPSFRDKVDVEVEVSLPTPMNTISVRLIAL